MEDIFLALLCTEGAIAREFCKVQCLDKLLQGSKEGEAVASILLEKVLVKEWLFEDCLIQRLCYLGGKERISVEEEDLLCQVLDLLLAGFQHPRNGERWLWVDDTKAPEDSPAGILMSLFGKAMGEATHCLAAQVLLALVTESMSEEDQAMLKNIFCCSYSSSLHLLAVYCSSSERTGHMAALEALRVLSHPHRALSPREALFSAIMTTLDDPKPSALPHAESRALETFREFLCDPEFFCKSLLLLRACFWV